MAITKAPPPLPVDRLPGTEIPGGASIYSEEYEFSRYARANDAQLERSRDDDWYRLRLRQKARGHGRPWSPK
jgi:hypothetical protein